MPRVTVIVPCFNEKATIRPLLVALLQQTTPCRDMQVVVADGMSTDGTRELIRLFQQEHPELRVDLVDNPRRIVPAALNRAIAAAEGEYIIRMDAHSQPAKDYVQLCVEDLEAGKGENVGGIWEIRPLEGGRIRLAIALAASNPLGAGDAQYRLAPREGWVDTVPFGSFRRETFAKVGLFDEGLLANEDYEFNARLRACGGRIWLNPLIRSTYYPRSNFGKLAQQYWRYGFWKWRMLLQHPSSLRWRQAVPPLFLAGLAGAAVMTPFWTPASHLLAGLVGVYALVLVVGSLPTALRHRSPSLLLLVPLAMAVMHLSWAGGFWRSALGGRPRAR